MAEKTEINYEQMQAIVKKFLGEQEEIERLLKDTKGRVDTLHNGGWIGRGSDQFYQEMESLLLPAVQRLANALAMAGQHANEIMDIYRQAEEEAEGSFKAFSE
jgi:WXG100 family type VII secretion target